jgi:hypothetical protein
VGIFHKVESLSVRLLEKLAVIMFNKYNTTLLNEQDAWGTWLIKLFQQASIIGCLNDMTPIIKAHKGKSTPCFDLSILGLFGEPMLDKLSLIDMIQHANIADLDLITTFKHKYTTCELKALANNVKTVSQIETLLAREEMTAEISDTIFNHDQSSVTHQDTAWLVNIAAQTSSHAVLMKLLQVRNPNDKLITALLDRALINEFYNSEIISMILALSYNFSEPMRISLAHKSSTNTQVKTLLAHPDAISPASLMVIVTKADLEKEDFVSIMQHRLTNEYVIQGIVDHRNFSNIAPYLITHEALSVELLVKLAISLFNQYNTSSGVYLLFWENCLIELFQHARIMGYLNTMTPIIKKHKNKFTPRLDLGILSLFGEPILHKLSLIAMIEDANNEELELIIRLKHRFTDREFKTLAYKVETVSQIDTLLARKDMSAEIGDILFDKRNFSFKMENWWWLTEKQCLKTLDNTSNYDSHRIALNHPNLSAHAKNLWFNRKKLAQLNSERDLMVGQPNFEQNIKVALSRLRLKSYELALKATYNHKYANAAKTSFDLYHKLDIEVKTFLLIDSPEHSTIIKFIDDCQKIINPAMPILAEHRGYKQALLDILNVIFTMLTFGHYYFKDQTNWRFFKADTNSVEIVNKFNQEVARQRP